VEFCRKSRFSTVTALHRLWKRLIFQVPRCTDLHRKRSTENLALHYTILKEINDSRSFKYTNYIYRKWVGHCCRNNRQSTYWRIAKKINIKLLHCTDLLRQELLQYRRSLAHICKDNGHFRYWNCSRCKHTKKLKYYVVHNCTNNHQVLSPPFIKV